MHFDTSPPPVGVNTQNFEFGESPTAPQEAEYKEIRVSHLRNVVPHEIKLLLAEKMQEFMVVSTELLARIKMLEQEKGELQEAYLVSETQCRSFKAENIELRQENHQLAQRVNNLVSEKDAKQEAHKTVLMVLANHMRKNIELVKEIQELKESKAQVEGAYGNLRVRMHELQENSRTIVARCARKVTNKTAKIVDLVAINDAKSLYLISLVKEIEEVREGKAQAEGAYDGILNQARLAITTAREGERTQQFERNIERYLQKWDNEIYQEGGRVSRILHGAAQIAENATDTMQSTFALLTCKATAGLSLKVSIPLNVATAIGLQFSERARTQIKVLKKENVIRFLTVRFNELNKGPEISMNEIWQQLEQTYKEKN